MKAITLLALFLIFISAPIVRADGTQSTFDYTGTPFTKDIGSAAGTTELTGSLTINGILPANAVLMPVTPTDFSFFDGFFNWRPQENSGATFEFSTDANGNIVGWNIRLDSLIFLNPDVPAFLFELISSWDQGVGQDSAQATRLSSFGPEYLDTSFIAGTWTSTETAATPEPPTYLLFLSGIGLILFVSMKRRTATAYPQPHNPVQC